MPDIVAGASVIAPSTPAAAAPGTVLTFEEARAAILNWNPPFRRSTARVETELAGRVDELGRLVYRTMSYLAVPVISAAVLGVEISRGFFPEFPMADFGASFTFTEAVRVVQDILRSGTNIERGDIMPDPMGHNTLYFAERLQTAVFNEMGTRFSDMYLSISQWTAQRFERELQQRGRENRTAPATPSPTPSAAAAGAPSPSAAPVTLPSLPTGPSTPAHPPAAPAPSGATSQGSTPRIADGHCQHAGVNQALLNRALLALRMPSTCLVHVEQPCLDQATKDRFLARMQAIMLASDPTDPDPAGRAWLALAFPCEHYADPKMDAAGMFTDGWADGNGNMKITVPGPSYQGVTVLAMALLGRGSAASALLPDSAGAHSESGREFWGEPCTGSDEWSIIWLESSDQLLPVFLGSMQRQTDGISAPQASLLSAPEAPAGSASEMHEENTRLRRKAYRLQKTVNELRSDAKKEASRQRVAEYRQKRRDADVVQGCMRVKTSEEEAPRCGMESIQLHPESESDQVQAPVQPGGKGKEIGIDRLFVKMKGSKAARRTAEGGRAGGLSWTNEEMAIAAGKNYSVYSVSLATAGAMAASYLRSKAEAIYVRAEALGKHKRRTKLPEHLVLFKDIPPRSLQRGVNSMQFAKNSRFLDFVRTAHSLALSFDSSTISKWSMHGVHVRAMQIVKKGPKDPAGTQRLGVVARSIVLDLLATGDKLTHEYSYTDEDGTQRVAPVEVPRCFVLQLMLGGIFWDVMRCRCVSVTCDGGGEGTGLGNRKLARQSMAGENSVVHLVWLLRRAGDQAVEMLNRFKLFGPLMDFYGFKWRDCDFLSRIPEGDRVDTVQELLKADAAAAAAASTARADDDAAIALETDAAAAVSLGDDDDNENADVDKDSAAGLDDDEDDDDDFAGLSDMDDEIPGDCTGTLIHDLRHSDKCPQPIFNPLGPSPPSQPMVIFDYVVWDVAAACPSLALPATIAEITEEMVAAVETYASRMINAALAEVADPEAFKNIVTTASLEALHSNRMVHDDAVTFVIQPITHALGGRMWTGGGCYSTGPLCPYIQDSRALAENVYVIDSQQAAKLAEIVEEAESKRSEFDQSITAMLRILKGRPNRRNQGERAAIGPDSTVFAATHLPGHSVSSGHFVSTEVQHLGQSGASVVMTRADSLCASPERWDRFNGRVQDALRIGFSAMGLIGESQKVEHFGLALPQQARLDCAFYMLTRLETMLSGQHLRPDLWQRYTRLKRSWTTFHVVRALWHAKALRTDVFTRLLAQHPPPAAHALPATPPAVSGALVPMPAPTRCAIADADDSAWVCAAKAQAATKAEKIAVRRRVLRQMRAAKVERVLGDVQALVAAAWSKQERRVPRRLETSGCVKASTAAPTRARSSPESSAKWMGEYDHLVRTAAARISMHKSPLRYYLMAEQDPSDTSYTNPHVQWCIRHRFHCACSQMYRRTDKFPDLAESAINFLRNPHFSHRAIVHITAFLGIKREGGDRVRPGLIHKEVQRAMKAQTDSPEPPNERRGAVVTRPSAHDRACALVSGKTGRLPIPRLAAATRWGTRPDGQQCLSQTAGLFAVSSIAVYGEASESTLADAARSVHEEKGLVDRRRFRVPPKVGKQLWFLTNQTDIFLCCLGRLINVLMVRPCMRAFSKFLECACFEVCGVSSFFRRSLIFWTTDFCVGKFNAADNMGRYRATSQHLEATSHLFDARRKKRGDPRNGTPSAVVKLAHRGWAGLRAAYNTAWLINPRAGKMIKERFGPHCTDDMVDAVDRLLSTMRRVAAMEGSGSEMMLYPTLEKEYQAAMALTPRGEKRTRELLRRSENSSHAAKSKALFARNMRKMQFAVVHVVQQDIVSAIVEWHDHELYSLFGFLGCTLLTVTLRARSTTTNEIVHIVTAHPDAIACALIASRMLDELFAHHPNETLANFVPTQLADLLNDEEAMRQLSRLCQGETIDGFVLVDEDGQDLKGSRAVPIAPAERHEIYAHLALQIVCTQLSSNDIERIFGQGSRGFNRGGKNVSPMAINSWCRRNDWVSGGFWGLEKDEVFLKEYGNARRFFQAHESRLRRLMEPDTETSEMRKMGARQAKLPARNRDGQQFGTSNIEPQAKASHVGPSCPSRDEFDDSMDPLPANGAKRKAVAGKRAAVPRPRKAASDQDRALRMKAKKARALHRKGPKGHAPAVSGSLQPPRKRRRVEKRTRSLPPGIAADGDQHGDEFPVPKRGEESMSYDEARGDDRCMDDAESGACMDAAEIEAGAPPNDVHSEEAAAASEADEGGDSELTAEAAGSASHPIVEGRQETPTAGAVKGTPLAASRIRRAKPARRASTAAEPKSSGGVEETLEEDSEEQAEASPGSSGALHPSCTSIKGASGRESNLNAWRARQCDGIRPGRPRPDQRRARE